MVKYTKRMQTVLEYSKDEARRLDAYSIKPAHILLAILRVEREAVMNLLNRVSTVGEISYPDIKRRLDGNYEDAEEKQTAKQTGMKPAGNCPLDFCDKSKRVLRLAMLEARQIGDEEVDIQHVLLGISNADDNAASDILRDKGVHYKDLAHFIYPATLYRRVFGLDPDDEEDDDDDEEMYTDLPEVQSDSDLDNDEEDEENNGIGTSEERFNYEFKKMSDGLPDLKAKAGSKRKMDSATPALDKFSTDLTKAAADGLLDPVVGRDKEILRVAQILSRRKKNNPLLIGDPGVGKTAIVEGLAQRIVDHCISQALWDMRVMVLDLSAMVAGTKYRGQFEERMRAVLKELKHAPNVIVFIDEIHTIVGAGNPAGSMDAANMLKPALARGEFQCIGSTTTEEFRKNIEKDGALERRFQKVMVEPPSTDETLTILQQLRKRYEEHHKVNYTDEALQACVRLTERYVTDRQLPDKAIDALDEAGSRIHVQDLPDAPLMEQMKNELRRTAEQKVAAACDQNFELASSLRNKQMALEKKIAKYMEQQENTTSRVVDATCVAHVVSLMTGIPVQRMDKDESTRLCQLGPTLKNGVIGQSEAVDTLVRAIQRGRVGLKDPRRPIGVFMFVGPTGVGKTYLTKLLAQEMFGSEDNIIRVDMSEYMEKHSVSRMIGAPPGYVGHEEGGQLTERVRRKPYSIILLDEIEKAHPDVFNVLLQMMDEGRLTDGNGLTTSFKNTVIIMTSNCGTRQARDFGNAVGFLPSSASRGADKAKTRDIVKKAIQKQFTPEFLNRLDEIIYFDPLDQESIGRIAEIELRPVAKRMEEIGHPITVTSEAKALICRKGFDPQLGARPLKRAIQTLLEDKLCECLMDGGLAECSTLTATAQGEQIIISETLPEGGHPIHISISNEKKAEEKEEKEKEETTTK